MNKTFARHYTVRFLSVLYEWSILPYNDCPIELDQFYTVKAGLKLDIESWSKTNLFGRRQGKESGRVRAYH